jgi:hypothetical protein
MREPITRHYVNRLLATAVMLMAQPICTFLRLDRWEVGSHTPATLTLNGKPAKLPGIQLKAGDVLLA